MTVRFERPVGRANAFGARLLKASQTEGVIRALAASFELPTELTVRGVNGFGAGPRYNPRGRSITLPYEFEALIFDTLGRGNPRWSARRLGAATAAAGSFILAHGFAHALIDVYDLPVLGREEDAADNIAAIVLLQAKRGERFALDAAELWAQLSTQQDPPQFADYADTHSLDLQRALGIVCAIAGSSRERLREVARLRILPRSRLASCPDEYEQLVDGFEQVLEPHLTEQPDLPSP